MKPNRRRIAFALSLSAIAFACAWLIGAPQSIGWTFYTPYRSLSEALKPASENVLDGRAGWVPLAWMGLGAVCAIGAIRAIRGRGGWLRRTVAAILAVSAGAWCLVATSPGLLESRGPDLGMSRRYSYYYVAPDRDRREEAYRLAFAAAPALLILLSVFAAPGREQR